MIHDHTLMILYGKQDQKVHIQICKFIVVHCLYCSKFTYLCMHLLVLFLIIGIQYSECTFYTFAGMRESLLILCDLLVFS